MNQQSKDIQRWSEIDTDAVDFDELESKLESDFEEQMLDLQILEEDRKKIGNPDSLGETVMNAVWEQFLNQISVVAGEDFIRENRGLTLDLRDSAHIQTTNNFERGKIATHNDAIDYQERHNKWQYKFQHDENGNVVTHTTRTGKQEATLAKGARKPFDKGRPVGSVEKGIDMDHTVSAGEIIRNPAANAHLSEQEQIDFANSSANLNEMDAGQNRSKGDKRMTDWLDNPNRNGQKPKEIFDIAEEQDQQYRKKDEEARAEGNKRIKEGEERSIKTGKLSQKRETFRIGGKALKAVAMGLLASLIKDIIRKLIAWFRSGNRKLNTFIEHVKEAIKSFVADIKEHLLNAADSFVTTVATAILGPVVGMIKKAWIFLKQGAKSLKEAIDYIKNPANKNKPFSIMMLEVGKIITGGLTVGGAILLGETIEKGLMTIPVFTINIPLLGSLASLLGMFFGALVSGILGALALNLIDKAIVKKQKQLNTQQQIEKMNGLLVTQDKLIVVVDQKFESVKVQDINIIKERHMVATGVMREAIENIMKNSESIDSPGSKMITNALDHATSVSENEEEFNQLFSDLKDL